MDLVSQRSHSAAAIVEEKHHRKHSRRKHKKVMEVATNPRYFRKKSKLGRSSKSLNMSLSSLDSGLPLTETATSNLLYGERDRLKDHLKECKKQGEEASQKLLKICRENDALKEDILMLQNLVYRLNVELEKRQASEESGNDQKPNYLLPECFKKNFLKPVLPLIKAYTNVIDEKEHLIQQLNGNLEELATNLQQIIKENETIYKELESRVDNGADSLNDFKLLKKELKMIKEERDLYRSQATIADEKLLEVQQIYSNKVLLAQKESTFAAAQLQELQTELSHLKGQNQVLKQELERTKIEEGNKISVIVHTSAINECKRLFQELKNQYELEKQKFLNQIKNLETALHERELLVKDSESKLLQFDKERLELEQGNIDLAVENDYLRRQLESGDWDPKKLWEAEKRASTIEGKLQTTKRQLYKAIAFAEDIVREQETLLAQLHQKQRENSRMASQFGSLKSQLQDVERGALQGLDSVEEKMLQLEREKAQLLEQVRRLNEKTFDQTST